MAHDSKQDEAVAQILKFAHEFADKAAEIAAAGYVSSLGGAHPETQVMVDTFRKQYASACFDAYMTGAIETLRIVQGAEQIQIPWMGEQNSEQAAAELLIELVGDRTIN